MTAQYLKNTAILFASMTITKIVGALFKIPLANVLGGLGCGYFSTAYGLYAPIFALTAAGIPTVMMKLTAQSMAANSPANALKTRRTALMLFSAAGLAGTLAVALFAGFFSEHIACSPESKPAVTAIAPAVLLCCVSSVIRGYHEGLSDVVPSAAAATAEAVSRAAAGLAAAYGVVFWAKHRFESGESVLGEYYADYSDVYAAVLPWAAAGAVAAVTFSELCGLITLLIYDRKKRSRPKAAAGESPRKTAADSTRTIIRRLIREIVPVSASALVMNCVSFVDLLTVTRTLRSVVSVSPELFADRELLRQCGGAEGLANFMYGSYTGIAMTVFMLIPSFAGMAEKTALPEIAAARERRDMSAAAHHCRTLLRASATIGFPVCLGAAALSEPILMTLYSRRAAEVGICSGAFAILCLGGLFMITASALFGVFQAIGKSHVPLVLMTVSVGIKAALNPLLMSVPKLNIAGAALASAAGYVFAAAAGAVLVKRYFSLSVDVFSCVKKPLFGSILCALSAFLVNNLLPDSLGNLPNTVISVFTGAFVYGIFTIINTDFREKRQFQKSMRFFSQKHLKNPQK